VARLAKNYASFTLDFILYDLPMDQGWAFYAWAIENDGWLRFNSVNRSGKGYVAQEIDRLMEIAKNGR